MSCTSATTLRSAPLANEVAPNHRTSFVLMHRARRVSNDAPFPIQVFLSSFHELTGASPNTSPLTDLPYDLVGEILLRLTKDGGGIEAYAKLFCLLDRQTAKHVCAGDCGRFLTAAAPCLVAPPEPGCRVAEKVQDFHRWFGRHHRVVRVVRLDVGAHCTELLGCLDYYTVGWDGKGELPKESPPLIDLTLHLGPETISTLSGRVPVDLGTGMSELPGTAAVCWMDYVVRLNLSVESNVMASREWASHVAHRLMCFLVPSFRNLKRFVGNKSRIVGSPLVQHLVDSYPMIPYPCKLTEDGLYAPFKMPPLEEFSLEPLDAPLLRTFLHNLNPDTLKVLRIDDSGALPNLSKEDVEVVPLLPFVETLVLTAHAASKSEELYTKTPNLKSLTMHEAVPTPLGSLKAFPTTLEELTIDIFDMGRLGSVFEAIRNPARLRRLTIKIPTDDWARVFYIDTRLRAICHPGLDIRLTEAAYSDGKQPRASIVMPDLSDCAVGRLVINGVLEVVFPEVFHPKSKRLLTCSPAPVEQVTFLVGDEDEGESSGSDDEAEGSDDEEA